VATSKSSDPDAALVIRGNQEGTTSYYQVDLTSVLEVTKVQFITQFERKFVEDLIVYLDYKIKETERIRNERKQLTFW
jgi:hypothetical protein